MMDHEKDLTSHIDLEDRGSNHTPKNKGDIWK